jgi:hypothetical protein
MKKIQRHENFNDHANQRKEDVPQYPRICRLTMHHILEVYRLRTHWLKHYLTK